MANNRTIKINDNVLDVTEIYKLYQPDGTNMFVYTDNDGNLHIDGNIIQNGIIYETHAEQLYTTKDFIITRNEAVSAISTISGIQITKYDGVNDLIFGTDSNGYFKVGEVSSLQMLATREDSPTNGYFAQWDSTNNRFNTIQLTESNISDFGTYLTDLSELTTDNLTEGITNKYFTWDYNWNDLINTPDLTIYAEKLNVLELNNTDVFMPTTYYHPATKKYVDDLDNTDHTQYALLNGRSGNILKIDILNEFTTDNGIIIDSVSLKDGRIFNSTNDAPTNDIELTNKKYVDDLDNVDHLQYALLNGRNNDILKIDEINDFTSSNGTKINGITINENIDNFGINSVKLTYSDSPYTITNKGLIECDTTNGNITINMLPAADINGKIFTIRKISQDNNYIEIIPNNDETINERLDYRIKKIYQTLSIYSNGNNLQIINFYNKKEINIILGNGIANGATMFANNGAGYQASFSNINDDEYLFNIILPSDYNGENLTLVVGGCLNELAPTTGDNIVLEVDYHFNIINQLGETPISVNPFTEIDGTVQTIFDVSSETADRSYMFNMPIMQGVIDASTLLLTFRRVGTNVNDTYAESFDVYGLKLIYTN